MSVLGALLLAGTAPAYPAIVHACGDVMRFDRAPRRPVVNDSNMVQTIIDMGLIDRFIGVSGIGGVEKDIVMPPATRRRINRIQFSPRYPSREAILGQDPDFYFAGWQYGMSDATGVTPANLAVYGVKSYVLNESCIRIGPRPPITMETLYTDLRAIGRIFGVTPRAETMIADFRKRVASVSRTVSTARHRPRVMYCGDCNGDAPPLSIGAEGMPKLLAKLAGGQNIFDDIPDSYTRVSWEAVIARDPEWIILSNPRLPVDSMIRYMTSAPALRDVTAIRRRQFIVMTYAERSPSTRNVDALERLARAIHPTLFAKARP